MNEGGLECECKRWRLPGFDTGSWTARDLPAGLPGGGAGVGFSVTTVDLAFPVNTNMLVSFQLQAINTQPYRALLLVNGCKLAKVIKGRRREQPTGHLSVRGGPGCPGRMWR